MIFFVEFFLVIHFFIWFENFFFVFRFQCFSSHTFFDIDFDSNILFFDIDLNIRFYWIDIFFCFENRFDRNDFFRRYCNFSETNDSFIEKSRSEICFVFCFEIEIFHRFFFEFRIDSFSNFRFFPKSKAKDEIDDFEFVTNFVDIFRKRFYFFPIFEIEAEILKIEIRIRFYWSRIYDYKCDIKFFVYSQTVLKKSWRWCFHQTNRCFFSISKRLRWKFRWVDRDDQKCLSFLHVSWLKKRNLICHVYCVHHRACIYSRWELARLMWQTVWIYELRRHIIVSFHFSTISKFFFFRSLRFSIYHIFSTNKYTFL